MNSVSLVGRVTRDLELKHSGETNVLKFNVAVNRSFKKEGQPDADFINCIAFNKTAEVISKYFKKGSQIGIEGHIQTGSYEKEDGTKVYTTDVIVRQITFLDKKSDDGASETIPSGYVKDESTMISDDELPF